MQETWDMGSVPGLEDPLEEGMAAQSSMLAWGNPWTDEPGGLQSMVSEDSQTLLKRLSMHTRIAD